MEVAMADSAARTLCAASNTYKYIYCTDNLQQYSEGDILKPVRATTTHRITIAKLDWKWNVDLQYPLK
jgi:hypothetical protein